MKKIFLFQKTSADSEQLVGRYNSEEDAQGKVLMLVEDGNANIFNFRIEAREYEDIKKRVKSYADACKVLGVEPMDETRMESQGFRQDEIARRKLETITEALNEGWKPNWADLNENKFFPYFDIEVNEVRTEAETDRDRVGGYAYYGANAGLSHASTGSAVSGTSSNVGSRLCFQDSESARYAGDTFTELYEQILIEKL